MSDPLTGALDALRITTTLYAMASLTGAWGVGFPATAGAYFHLVRGEPCWLTTDDLPAEHLLDPGDAVLLPHGTAHRLTARRGGSVRAVFDAQEWTTRRGAPADPDTAAARTELVCGAVRVRRPRSHPVLAMLPSVVHVRADGPGTAELRLVAQVLAAETGSDLPGADAVLARLGDVLLVQLLRTWTEQQRGSGTGWLAALADPGIARAIAALHAEPARAWTVARLAALGGLSRSRFAERFTAVVGQPPLTYLAAWRMACAADLLAEPSATVREVGNRVGFRSEPAFSRAFSRHYGVPPSRYRKDAES